MNHLFVCGVGGFALGGAVLFLLVVLLPTATVRAAAFSSLSSFTGNSNHHHRRRSSCGVFCKNSLVMYDSSRDPPSSPEYNAWTVLSKTEKWISTTLLAMGGGNGSGSGSGPSNSSNNNPYARKEVSYACETGAADTPMVVANIFRRLKEVRELGERHGKDEGERAEKMGASYEPSTLRQTQVVVVPGNGQFDRYAVFDQLVTVINQARRNARDYVTDISLEKLVDADDDDDDDELNSWSVSVNLAHLHPNFGELTPQQELEQLKQEDEDEEIDVNLQQYKERKMMCRRSPYPTLVIEVRAMPPPNFGEAPPPTSSETSVSSAGAAVTSTDVQELEALFGKSAHLNHPTAESSPKQQEDAFYDSIGGSITEVSSVTPLNLAQTWIAANDPDLAMARPTAAFTESDTKHVDAAYQFIFTNLAMLMESAKTTASPKQQQRQYLVMPHFLSSSATSFEKFKDEVQHMISVLPDLKDRAGIETFHPEHVDSSRRSPLPVFVLTWKE